MGGASGGREWRAVLARAGGGLCFPPWPCLARAPCFDSSPRPSSRGPPPPLRPPAGRADAVLPGSGTVSRPPPGPRSVARRMAKRMGRPPKAAGKRGGCGACARLGPGSGTIICVRCGLWCAGARRRGRASPGRSAMGGLPVGRAFCARGCGQLSSFPSCALPCSPAGSERLCNLAVSSA